MTDAQFEAAVQEVVESPPWGHANHLIWIDLETTGLDPTTHTILEIGVVVTTANYLLKPIAHTSQLVNELDHFLSFDDHEKMVPEMHRGEGGLLWRAYHDGVPLIRALDGIGGWLNGVFDTLGEDMDSTQPELASRPIRPGPMCGSSVHFDRAFLMESAPLFVERWWTYRNFDISTLVEFAAMVAHYQPKYHPKAHLALADLQATLLQARDVANYLRRWTT